MKSYTESNLQENICNYLSMICRRWGFIYFAPMNETAMMILKMFKVSEKKCYAIMNWLKKMGFLPGVSDIIIGHNGKMFCMELKLPDEKKHVQKKSQILFEDGCKRAGVEYRIVRSLEECSIVLKRWGWLGDSTEIQKNRRKLWLY